MDDVWENAQEFETDWHGSNINSLGEEIKQTVYAKKMGLSFFHNGKSPYNIDVEGEDILDIGGGPNSLLLKCENLGSGSLVVDPLSVPQWVLDRYGLAGIGYSGWAAEDYPFPSHWDEIWVYNCLQHTKNPETIIEKAMGACNLIRIFEWVNTVQNVGHPHVLTSEKLDEWLGGEGRVEHISEKGCVGECYYGIFPT